MSFKPNSNSNQPTQSLYPNYLFFLTSHTLGYYPAVLIVPGPGKQKTRDSPFVHSLLKLFQLANPKPVQPARLFVHTHTHANTIKSLAHRYPLSLFRLTDPGASPKCLLSWYGMPPLGNLSNSLPFCWHHFLISWLYPKFPIDILYFKTIKKKIYKIFYIAFTIS